ncbi:type II secretion system F family protein [Candidatus Nitrosotenuis sp. DW1]|uniref:type II secretion system F family protein n=1 Tax=Candidatus Nitrosotenuis sp. DW1 TaxID=2259672 RepID=UPI0015C98A8F|nr:type II secretion system F family protein [Candidatus Nitrosotenuis sp. DW1]QLH09351.1 Type II secretion system F protein [Candidatus Nitrosotenuis sp. DW1]
MKINSKNTLQKIASQITFRSTWNTIIEDINSDVLFSGKPLDTIKLLNQIRKYMIISAFVIFPLSIFMFVYISPIFIVTNLIWIFIIAYPKIQQSQLSQTRKKKVEEELPYFVIFASVMQSVGVSLYDSFQLFKETMIFTAVKNEAQLLKRNVEYFGLSQMEALEELGRTHKSSLLKNLILGYTSIWRSGGDLSLYLETRAEEFFTQLKQRYQVYTNNVSTVIEALVTLLIILPILIMVVSFVLPGGSIEQVGLLASVGLPLFAIIMGVIISSIQPASFNSVGLDQKMLSILFGVGMISGLGTYLMYHEVWLSILVGFLIPSSISAVLTGRHINEIVKLERDLPNFLRDITEYKKIGYDILLAIINLSKDNTYNSVFAKKLSEVGLLLDNGISPTESVKTIDFRSHFTKMSFYLLAYIAEFGGGNPKNLETVNSFITNAKNTVKEGTSAISALAIIVFAAPVIMVFTASMIQNITGSIDTSIGSTIKEAATDALGPNSNFINLVTITPEFISMIKTLIVTSSILGAFVITKAIDFTFYNTWRVVAIGIITLVSILYLDGITSINFDSFLGNLSFK